ncbi:TIM-barrel domain-containing protein [Tenacibaculum sp. UWU-22]|uniref:TIM-barrel domain-containing protein n=1 Tax=Tenacibaculum sp. UWU-22 TaxID=3234187 RepID=UPI0034DB086F
MKQTLYFLIFLIAFTAIAQENTPSSMAKTAKIVSAKKINTTTVQITFSNQQKMLLDFYGDNIVRLFQDNLGGNMRAPEAKPEAQILVDNPRKPVTKLTVSENEKQVLINTNAIEVSFTKNTSLFNIINLKTKAVVVAQTEPIVFDKNSVQLDLKENPEEYFYGGGVQNGRFSHKGKTIAIENQNSWTDGGVASPAPFYWSTGGYAFMWYTFKKGKYSFGSTEKETVKLTHDTNYLDVFFMIDNQAVDLLNDYYQLTGNPVLLPKFGFYEGHLNAYNRDYWKESDSEKAVLFEDGKRYRESQKDNGGIKESLNGEKNNYQFSARAVIDRYKNNDMPLGWILPNDGYGAGYGQTETLDGNIKNLKEFGDYARKNGVEIGLWTQSDLHPKKDVSALLQRDIIKEVGVAGVRVLKTDVAWVGRGYSFGLNGIADVAKITSKQGNDARPFIISLDGWAGTQRYAGIWSGDQTGGVWEYIRFHIPTYIGSGLSGIPNITSDMDGIFGGRKPIINIRDFQWKTFTPMQLNMDGWGANPKYPTALGESATSINRNYLKLKSELIPYTYSIAKQAVTGLPIIRAMFLEDPNDYTKGIATQYQFMYGPNFLVAPIYQATKSDDQGNDIRNNIYLPKGQWIDYFTGKEYEGGQIINDFPSPIWKLPVFVKKGAIIPMANASNNVSQINKSNRIYDVYPYGNSSFTEYDDDGITEAYKNGEGIATLIESQLSSSNKLKLTVHKTTGNYNGFVKNKTTEFRINVTKKPKKLTVKINGKKVKLKEVHSLSDFNKNINVYFYNKKPNFNQFSTKGSEFEKVAIIKNPQFLVKVEKTDVTTQKVELQLKKVIFDNKYNFKQTTEAPSSPTNVNIAEENKKPYSIQPTWDKVNNADYYEISFDNMRYSTIKDTSYVFENLTPETSYSFKIRSVNKKGKSPWVMYNTTTSTNPFKYAIHKITGEANVESQSGHEISKLFDFDESNLWHTIWGKKSIPFNIEVDLHSVNQLDKFEYVQRSGGSSNGIILKGKVYYSTDKTDWTLAGDFDTNGRKESILTFNFDKHPVARYIKIAVSKAVNNFGSGKELYVFKVPGTESFYPGDINNDKNIDSNDLTSYTNYIGLQKGDSDFEGYITKGDVNKNGYIDAYDVSVVATQLEGGVNTRRETQKVSGQLTLSTPKKQYTKGEMVEITVKGVNLTNVNALGFALPYDNKDYEFVSIKPLQMEYMENLTNNRLHTNGSQVLYPTFVNLGNQFYLKSNADLFVIKFKAKRDLTFNLHIEKGMLVDRKLETATF